jgi:hypothetical protein
MKKLLVIAFAVAGISVFAADAKEKDKAIDIKGEGKCAKCALKEKDACQNVVVVEKAGKKTTYYFVNNEISKGFHKNVCSGPAKVKATGTCKEVSGKMEFTATKIELDKDAKDAK